MNKELLRAVAAHPRQCRTDIRFPDIAEAVANRTGGGIHHLAVRDITRLGDLGKEFCNNRCLLLLAGHELVEK